MRRFLTSRLFRAAVCLILVCCFIINVSPIRAQAVLATATLVSIGVAAVLILGIMGIVIVCNNEMEYAAVGQSLSDWMYASCDKPESQITNIQVGVWLEDLGNAMSGNPGGPNDRITPSMWSVFITTQFMLWAKQFAEGFEISYEDVSTDGLVYVDPYTHILGPGDTYSRCSVGVYWGSVRYEKNGALELAYVFISDSSHFVFSNELGHSYPTPASGGSFVLDGVTYYYYVRTYTNLSDSDLVGSYFLSNKLSYTSQDLPIALLTGICTDYIAPEFTVPTVILDDIYYDDEFVEIGRVVVPDIEYVLPEIYQVVILWIRYKLSGMYSAKRSIRSSLSPLSSSILMLSPISPTWVSLTGFSPLRML